MYLFLFLPARAVRPHKLLHLGVKLRFPSLFFRHIPASRFPAISPRSPSSVLGSLRAFCDSFPITRNQAENLQSFGSPLSAILPHLRNVLWTTPSCPAAARAVISRRGRVLLHLADRRHLRRGGAGPHGHHRRAAQRLRHQRPSGHRRISHCRSRRVGRLVPVSFPHHQCGHQRGRGPPRPLRHAAGAG